MLVKSTFVLLFFAQQSRSAFYKTDGNHNVLFIVVDDLRHLSADKVNLTNIQKLTARGVRFQHAYAQVGTYLNDMWLSILYLPNWHNVSASTLRSKQKLSFDGSTSGFFASVRFLQLLARYSRKLYDNTAILQRKWVRNVLCGQSIPSWAKFKLH